MKNPNPRGWVYIGLFVVGAVLLVTGLVKADTLLEWMLTVAVAAEAAGNLLARAFLSPREPAPDELDK